MARYDTAANIITDVAVEVGLAAPADVWASTDSNVVQLRTLLKSVGRGLVLEYSWLQTVLEHTLTTTAATSYALPDGYLSVVDGTAWNRTTRMPLYPASPQQWQALEGSVAGLAFTTVFRPGDASLRLYSPTAGETVALEYRSRNWVAPSGSTTPDDDAPTENDDVVCLDVQLATRALKLAFLRAKGFDTSAALMEYQAALEAAQGTNVGAAPVLSINGGCLEEPLLGEGTAVAVTAPITFSGGLF